jgi:predicted AlkP superfamily phosphohydrolase/phosphomutase
MILAAAAHAWLPRSAEKAKKVVILGVDGLDPGLLQSFVDSGNLPNFKRLIAQGSFKPLTTTMPPLSPVAWSTFITGMDPGGHAIFDFLHRDPASVTPQFSMSRAVPASWTLNLGSWEIPLKGGSVEQLRRGRAFWEILEERRIPATIYRMPVNFPPSKLGHSLSGMGTPDILGTPGTFTFYTDNPPENAEGLSGGKVVTVQVNDHRVQTSLLGPENSLKRIPKDSNGSGGAEPEYTHPQLTADFTVHVDPGENAAKFVVQDKEFILNQGEWSDWVRVDFAALPYLVNVSAVCRFYLQQVRPDFRLYVSPLQINPEEPVMPISNPENWSKDLQKELGYFYTQELPEDTKAFSGHIFSGHEFWQQSQFVYREQRRALDHALKNFRDGLLFFYFSSVDQGSHMMWGYMDRKHPSFEDDIKLQGAIRTLYEEIDEALGKVMASIDSETTLIVMSDHGFAPFYWGINLNSWLLEKGYARLIDPLDRSSTLYQNVDWTGTTAYALGLNGLYLNLSGREANGIVPPGEYQKVLDRLEADLLGMRDPRTGLAPVTLVVQTRRDFKGSNIDVGPDIIVGYNRGYRTSWASPLGEFPRGVFVDNAEPWSGDHCVDYRLVPGVLISNRKITLPNPALYDLTVAVLDEYGAPKADGMIGRDCLEH